MNCMYGLSFYMRYHHKNRYRHIRLGNDNERARSYTLSIQVIIISNWSPLLRHGQNFQQRFVKRPIVDGSLSCMHCVQTVCASTPATVTRTSINTVFERTPSRVRLVRPSSIVKKIFCNPVELVFFFDMHSNSVVANIDHSE